MWVLLEQVSLYIHASFYIFLLVIFVIKTPQILEPLRVTYW